MWHAWSYEQDTRLRELAGTRPAPAIAARLSEEHGIPRTVAAVRVRAKRLGVSLYVNAVTLGELERVFGVSHHAIVRWWLRPGLMAATRWAGRGPHAGWWIEEAAVARFVREHAYAYDMAAMLPGHRWTRLAEVAQRADRWLTWSAAAAYVGISTTNLDRWLQRGRVQVDVRRRYGAGDKGRIMVRARDLAALREAIQCLQAKARRRSRDALAQRLVTAPRDGHGRLLRLAGTERRPAA